MNTSEGIVKLALVGKEELPHASPFWHSPLCHGARAARNLHKNLKEVWDDGCKERRVTCHQKPICLGKPQPPPFRN